jgi:DNA-3-methyladenine glycosylase
VGKASRVLRDALSAPAEVVAPRLLGWTLSHTTDEGTVSVELTEVEAYAGESDPASHAFRGETPRNRVMFGEAGRLYVYRSHGIHLCLNIVTGMPGEASAVLLRAGRVIEGEGLARARRGDRVAGRSLARGPGCLGQALGVDLNDSGADLLTDAAFALRQQAGEPADGISSGPRVGVSRAQDVAWRFWATDDATVSAYRRGVPRGQPRDRPGSAASSRQAT